MGDILLEPNDLVDVSRSNGRIIVRFSSPSTRNPLSSSVLAFLEQVISFCETDDITDELLFTGTDDVFASGADLREIDKLTPTTALEFGLRGQSLMNRIAGLQERTTAFINGFCFGGALDLALACDKRIASANATFCHPGVALGIITGWGGTQCLPRLIGPAKAFELFMTASPINARTALEIGLIDEISDELK